MGLINRFKSKPIKHWQYQESEHHWQAHGLQFPKEKKGKRDRNPAISKIFCRTLMVDKEQLLCVKKIKCESSDGTWTWTVLFKLTILCDALNTANMWYTKIGNAKCLFFVHFLLLSTINFWAKITVIMATYLTLFCFGFCTSNLIKSHIE